jgi:hypothetical protein
MKNHQVPVSLLVTVCVLMKILGLHTENNDFLLLLGESWLRASAVNTCKLYCNIFVGFKVLTVVTIKNKFNLSWHKKPYSLKFTSVSQERS